MPTRTTAVALLLLYAWTAPRVLAEKREQRPIPWDGLAVVMGHTVRIVMPDGARIEGRATELQPDALAVEIRKTTNSSSWPKGHFLVPRATLKAVDVERSTTHWSILTIGVTVAIGAFLGVLAIALATSNFSNRHAIVGGLAAGAVGVPTAGVFLGRKADRATITYVIQP